LLRLSASSIEANAAGCFVNDALIYVCSPDDKKEMFAAQMIVDM